MAILLNLPRGKLAATCAATAALTVALAGPAWAAPAPTSPAPSPAAASVGQTVVTGAGGQVASECPAACVDRVRDLTRELTLALGLPAVYFDSGTAVAAKPAANTSSRSASGSSASDSSSSGSASGSSSSSSASDSSSSPSESAAPTSSTPEPTTDPSATDSGAPESSGSEDSGATDSGAPDSGGSGAPASTTAGPSTTDPGATNPSGGTSGSSGMGIGDQVTVTGPSGTVTGTVTAINPDGTVTVTPDSNNGGSNGNSGGSSATPTSTAPASSTVPASTAPAPSGESGQVLDQVNQARTGAKCQPLTADPAMDKVAQAYAEQMAGLVDGGTPMDQALSHVGPDKQGPGQRGAAGGVNVQAENIAAGYSTAQEVVAGWMSSTGHADTIKDCNLGTVGTGVASAKDGTKFWVQDFGTASGSATPPASSSPSDTAAPTSGSSSSGGSAAPTS